MKEAAIAVLSAVLGAILGYGAKWWQDRLEEGRRRRAVATALLNDLRELEPDIAYVRDHWLGGDAYAMISAPMFERFSDYMHLFEPFTVSICLSFASDVRALQHLLKADSVEARDTPLEEMTAAAELARNRARMAMVSLYATRRALVSELGERSTVPEHLLSGHYDAETNALLMDPSADPQPRSDES